VNSEFQASVPNGTVLSAAVQCSTGKRPVGGGWEPLIATGTGDPTPGFGNSVFLTPAMSAPTADGWTVSLRNGSGSSRSNVQFRVWAVCVVQP
jgi:hypothetical protein